MQQLVKEFRQKLAGEGVFGIFSKLSDPAVAEIMGYAGADFIIIDLEHGPNTVQSAQNLVRAAQVGHILPIVRCKETYASVMNEALDIGAGGIQVPQVNTAEAAQAVMQRTRFAPLGERGVCRFVRAAHYSAMDRYEYFKAANDCITVLQLEGEEGIRNLDAILEVPGVDVLFIGPYDLSQSLGVPGQVDHPAVEEAMRAIVQRCLEKGVVVGTFADTVEAAHKWRAMGVKYLSYSVDVGIFYDAVKALKQQIMP